MRSSSLSPGCSSSSTAGGRSRAVCEHEELRSRFYQGFQRARHVDLNGPTGMYHFLSQIWVHSTLEGPSIKPFDTSWSLYVAIRGRWRFARDLPAEGLHHEGWLAKRSSGKISGRPGQLGFAWCREALRPSLASTYARTLPFFHAKQGSSKVPGCEEMRSVDHVRWQQRYFRLEGVTLRVLT